MSRFALVMATLAVADAMRAAGTPAHPAFAVTVRTCGPRLCAIEEAERTAEGEDGPELRGVYLLNDKNYNGPREYVSRVIMMVSGLTESEAGDVMMQAQLNGRAIVGSWEAEIAEHVLDGMTQAGIKAEVERAQRRQADVRTARARGVDSSSTYIHPT